jgi:NADPH-dependent ferric siderophore reductase
MSRRFHEATVLGRRVLTPGMVRLTLGGPGLADFVSTGMGDEYLRLFFPDATTGELALPVIEADGRWTYPAGPSKVRCSTYTVRRHDAAAGEIDIDFVVHEGGLASEWAQRAAPGDRIVINSPHGLYAPPADTAWQVLACDATGLPALGRVLETISPNIQTRVIVEVAEISHRQELVAAAPISLTWLEGGNGVGPSRLEEAVRSVPLPGRPGYLWVAGEQKVVRGVRRYARQELKLGPERYEIVGYWVAQQAEWDAGWKALDPAVRERIEAAWASNRDPEEVRDEVDAAFEQHGL